MRLAIVPARETRRPVGHGDQVHIFNECATVVPMDVVGAFIMVVRRLAQAFLARADVANTGAPMRRLGQPATTGKENQSHSTSDDCPQSVSHPTDLTRWFSPSLPFSTNGNRRQIEHAREGREIVNTSQRPMTRGLEHENKPERAPLGWFPAIVLVFGGSVSYLLSTQSSYDGRLPPPG